MDNNLSNENVVNTTKMQTSNIIVENNNDINNLINKNKDMACKQIDIDFLLNVILGLFIVYLIYLFLHSCKNNNKYEQMENPDDNYMLEQNMYKNLSDSKRKEYIDMDSSEKKDFFNDNV
jgi:hypothetical protein